MGEGCPQLQALNLTCCEQMTDVGITKIGEGCPQLQSLYLYGCYKVTDVGISNITDACQIYKRWNFYTAHNQALMCVCTSWI